jgi:transcriptional regulator with XRE-family HTH domain
MARVEAGLTQKRLGELLGTNQSSVAAWESGKVVPKVLTLMALAKVLKADVRAFVDAAQADLQPKLDAFPVS